MIVFAIPLRPKETAKNWEGVENRFWNTIRSIFNQVEEEYRVIVACNEIPEMPETMRRICDDRLEFIELDMPIPTEWIEMARDKFWKLLEIAVRIREILKVQEHPEKGIYVLPVDADDLLNCKIAQWCERYPDENGFVSNEGYVWENGKPYFRIYKEMYTYCGSCNIIKMYLEDLPENMPADIKLCHDRQTAAILNARYPIRWDHNLVVDKYRSMGKPFSILPFRSTVYLINNGDNISTTVLKTGNKDKKRFHPVAFLRSINIFKMRFISRKITKEFGMN